MDVDLEEYLRKAQDEIGEALSSLPDLSQSYSDLSRRRPHHRDLNRHLSLHALPQKTQREPLSNSVDFHSIFAQNNLLLSPEAKTSSGELRWPHAQSAPSLKRIPDRPQTLNHVTRPPECHALKGQDWKFYVQGDWSYNSLPNKRKVDANFFFTIPSKTPRVVDNHAAPPKEFTVIKTNLGWDNLHRNDHVTQRVRVINMPASVPHQSKPDNHRLQEVKKRERNCRVQESKDDFCSALSVVAQPLELAQIASLRNERRSRSESPDKRTRVKVKRSRSKSKESDRTSLYSTQMLDSNTSRSTQTKQTSKALLENNRRESPSKYRKEVSSNCTQSPSKSNRQSYRRSSKDYGTSDSEQECDCKECRNLPDRLLKSGVIQKASRNNFAPLELQNSRCKPVVLSSPTSPSKSFVKCQERKDLKKQSLNGLKSAPPLVIPVPSREQRRVRAKPQMPVIVEDVAQKTEEHLSSSSGTSTLTREKPKPVNSPDSCESGIVSDAGHVAPVSLLDAMYRKYCSNRHTQTTVASPVAPDLEPAYLGVKSPRPARSPSSAASDTDFSLSLPPREGWMSGQPSVSPDSGHSSAANTLSSTGSSASPSPPEPVEAKLEDEIIASEQQQQQNEMSPAPPSHLSETEILEIEAVEACRWLRAAGFPQYAQMYEDQGFPIDVTSVEKDHDFLDKDSLQSLFRRLNTLNKCVTMKIEAPPRKMGDDSDEDDQCALSDKWRFQRNSQRWSRKDLIPASPKMRLQSSSSRDSVITDNEGSVSGDSPVTLRQKSSVGIDLNFSEIPQSKAKMSSSGHISDSDTSVGSSSGPLSPSIRRAASEKFKGARNFLKRMESFKSRKTRSPKDLSRIQIGQPVLVDTPETQQRIDQLGCIDLTPQLSRKPVENLQKQVREMELQSIAKRSCDHDHFGVSSDHAPGSFPKVLTNGNSVKEQRVSLYDNLSDAEVDLSTVDPQEELDRILQELYQNISGLDATLEMAGQSEPSTIDTTDTSTDKRLSADLDTTVESRERRDSGVGSSLTRRASSEDCRHRIRWHSFIQSHRPLSQSMPLSTLTASQLMLLRKLALLKVTTLMEKHSPSNRSGWNWIMPKFIKRWKTPDYSQQRVFGVPLLLILQRTGQPLPQCILRAMRCLRRTALDAVGIFRKSGVRSRIQKLRNQMESDPDSVDFDTLQSYDVADLLKLYFRELPECLLTNKLSETFISIFTHVPSELRLEAVQSAIMLLPDENRHVLLSLLYFLSDMANHSHVNQMNGSNLAVCFAPSLFNMGASLRPSSNAQSSPKRVRKGTGLPDQKELLDQQAAHQCLTQMIAYCKLLFQVPDDMLSKCRLSCLEEGHAPTLDEIAGNSSSPLLNAQSHLEGIINSMILESKDRSKGWISCSSLSPPTEHSVEVAYKKALDGHPLRLWKACIDVEAPPVELLNRVLRERHLWDEDLLQWRIVEKLSSDLEIFQYQRAGMAPHPTVDMCELRSWKTDLPKGACALVSMSVEHPAATPLGGARGLVLASRFLIEPCGAGMSRLTYISRIDNLGHTTECYNRCYGRLCANQLVAIRNSFSQPLADGPETKV